jgi:hypothetical protein
MINQVHHSAYFFGELDAEEDRAIEEGSRFAYQKMAPGFSLGTYHSPGMVCRLCFSSISKFANTHSER